MLIGKFKYISIISGLLLVFTLGCKKELKLDDQTVAIVGKYSVAFKDYKSRYQEYLDATYQKDNLFLRLGVLRNMINEILLRNYDDNKEIFENPEFKKEINWAKKEMVLAYLKEEDIYSKIEVSDEQARKAFMRLNEKIAARHLYAPTEEEAYRLYNLLMKGASFDSLARVVFTDSTLKNNGGYLGYFTWGDMDPAFEDAAYGMKPGEISKPVKTAQGYSIIKVEDRKKAPILTETEYLKKKEQIIRILKISKKKEYERKYLKTVFDEQKLSFNDESLKQLLDLIKNGESSSKEISPTVLKREAAEYDGQKLSIGTVLKEIRQIPYYHRKRIDNLKKLKAAIKGLLINNTLLNIAEEKNYAQVPEVKRAIQNAENNLYLKYKRKEVLAKAQVPDSVLRVYYRKKIKKFNKPPLIDVREILVKDFQRALRLKKRLLDGEDFAALAKKYSLRQWSAQKGGEIGYSELDRFGNLKKILWDAPVGKIIGPVKIEDYYGLFRVEGKIESKPMTFEEAKEAVLEEYKGEFQTELMRDYLKKLRQKVPVKRNLNLVKKFIL
ncbi:MAG: hypothetical protein GXO77_13230 [Calditrichaeota bacterium]|nr:hypothetical protein [Calditrichota bacterium]